ncbi:MAG TPA: hypothetical protein VNO34_07445 [Actinomycetota bacterium]|nr:hypothetical protein [Actinomycetota bacterium]
MKRTSSSGGPPSEDGPARPGSWTERALLLLLALAGLGVGVWLFRARRRRPTGAR